MIKIDSSTVDIVREQVNREGVDYLKPIFDKVNAENPELLQKLVDNAEAFADNLVELRSELSDEDFHDLVKLNSLMHCLALYHCINNQQEIDELERLYG